MSKRFSVSLPPRADRFLIWAVVFLSMWLSGVVTDGRAASLIYKNYIVRFDRGWDILCEPYQVRQGDWVLKIFRQKGEIAHQDFREFLSIFQRLNPHIQDIDMIRPGQTVDIPLRKLEHGSLPGQASGVVTIPIVALTRVEELIAEHSKKYQVQWGDTVSKLIARQYGRYGSARYNEGVKLFKEANPDIVDLDRIYAGQTVYLPDPALREEAGRAGLDDDQANLPAELGAGAGRLPAAVETAAQAGDETQAKASDPLQEAAAVLGGKFHNKGTHYVPRPDGADFEIDLSRHPLLELENQPDLVFTQNSEVMGQAREVVQGFWPDAKVVTYQADSSVQEIVGAIFDALGEGGAPVVETAQTAFDDQGVQVSVQAKWIRPEGDGRRVCIRPIERQDDQTPVSLSRYLEQHGVILKELLPGNQAPDSPASSRAERHAIRDVLDLAPSTAKEFVQNVSRALGFSFSSNVGITFPYAGVMVEAYSNLLSAGQEKELLVDFGDLYGDALKAIRQSGPEVVQIFADEPYDQIVRKLLTGLGMPYDDNPSFRATPDSAHYHTIITVSGILLNRADHHPTLLTGAALPVAITELISAKGISTIQW